jgi:hypothetical protein
VTTILASPVASERRKGTGVVIGESWATAAVGTMTRVRTSVEARALVRNRNQTPVILTMNDGARATVKRATETIRARSSRKTSTCPVDRSVRSFAIEVASTRYAARNRERSLPSPRFEWSPVAAVLIARRFASPLTAVPTAIREEPWRERERERPRVAR